MPRPVSKWSGALLWILWSAPINGAAAPDCRQALAQQAVCEAANDAALGAMRANHLEAVTVMQDVRSGALVAFAASAPARLDVSTLVLPLSLSKVFLAASWWDRGQPDVWEHTASGKPVDVHEMLVGGSDSAGKDVALALRKAAGTQAVFADFGKYGFHRGTGPFWAEVDPGWRKRLTPQPAYAKLEALDDQNWSSALSIGESYMMTSALQMSRFFQAAGNDGVLCAASARRTTEDAQPGDNRGCAAPVRMMEATTAKKLRSALRDTVLRGSARRIAHALDDTGWAIGGKTGTGGRAGAPMEAQDGWFAGLILDERGEARYTVATFVRRGGLGSGHAAEIGVTLARFFAREAGASGNKMHP
jgi:cell division protein FtsI/penicillin-binding protein 2